MGMDMDVMGMEVIMDVDNGYGSDDGHGFDLMG